MIPIRVGTQHFVSFDLFTSSQVFIPWSTCSGGSLSQNYLVTCDGTPHGSTSCHSSRLTVQVPWLRFDGGTKAQAEPRGTQVQCGRCRCCLHHCWNREGREGKPLVNHGSFMFDHTILVFAPTAFSSPTKGCRNISACSYSATERARVCGCIPKHSPCAGSGGTPNSWSNGYGLPFLLVCEFIVIDMYQIYLIRRNST